DEAPSHVLFSAGSLPWTYPKHAVAATYPVETYQDGSDLTLDGRPEIVISAIVGIWLGGAGGGGGGLCRDRLGRPQAAQAVRSLASELAPPGDGCTCVSALPAPDET